MNGKFSVKVFILFSACIFIGMLLLIGLFLKHQSQNQNEQLIKKGKLLTRILAHNCVIGIFSENEELLKGPIDSVAYVDDVLEVFIFNANGKLINRREKHPTVTIVPGIPSHLNTRSDPLLLEKESKYCFWSPVTLTRGVSVDEALFSTERPHIQGENIIGYVYLGIDRAGLKTKFRRLLVQCAIVGFIFLIMGTLISFFISSQVTRPLYKLLDGVKKLDNGETVAAIRIDSSDEFGKLARAFNVMSQSLQKRQSALKESEQTLRFLSNRLFMAQEKERKRISIELHDEMGQSLVLLKHRVRGLKQHLGDKRGGLEKACDETIEHIDATIENTRRLSKDLSPAILEDLGLAAALRWMTDNFHRQHQIPVTLEMDAIDHLFPDAAQTNIYRIFQEILNNIGKHADPSHVFISAKVEGGKVCFAAEDNGRGFDIQKAKDIAPAERGMGLAAMHERSRMLQATLHISSIIDKGTRIELVIPYHMEAGHGQLPDHHCG